MVPGLLGEHGLAAALAVVWVQGNLTENSDDAIVLGRVKIKVASANRQWCMSYQKELMTELTNSSVNSYPKHSLFEGGELAPVLHLLTEGSCAKGRRSRRKNARTPFVQVFLNCNCFSLLLICLFVSVDLLVCLGQLQ